MVALKEKREKCNTVDITPHATLHLIDTKRRGPVTFALKLMKLIYTNPLFYCLQTFKPQRQAIYFSSHKGKHIV